LDDISGVGLTNAKIESSPVWDTSYLKTAYKLSAAISSVRQEVSQAGEDSNFRPPDEIKIDPGQDIRWETKIDIFVNILIVLLYMS